ncbi:Complement C3 [Collichthys lucidus]|uniref:Complement C3 n=1 Tax=Collichthys lucidus TaxID=240159 RepID=A0A4U5U4A3_COLLU|nr:Complement C3 [Collichthys lucidus]
MGWWMLHNILFFVLFCNSNGQIDSIRRFTLLAPDLLRAGSQENIYLQADGVSNPVTVSISIQDFTKTTTLLQDSVTLNLDNGFHALKTIQLPLDNLNRDEKKHNYVYLKVNFQDIHSEERILMVSFHSGYIFIQTDKPIYNPGDTVRFRAYVSSPSFKAFDSPITIDIQNPDGVVVNNIYRTRAVDGVFGETFPLSEFVKYLYGEPVQGTAYVVFGVKINQEMIRLPSVKQVSDLEGGVVSLSMEELKTAYPNIRSLVGNSVYVKASVLTKSGSDLVEKEKTGIQIVESPYVVSFKDTPKYFKPGLPFDFTVRFHPSSLCVYDQLNLKNYNITERNFSQPVQIQVSHHDGSPARNVLVKVNLLDTPLTVSSGTTRATINMPTNQSPQTITVETTQADLRPEQQAKQQVTVQPFVTFNQRNKNYLYISTGTNRASVGDNLSLKLSITVADQADREHIKQVTYLVLNKGKIIVAKRVDVQTHQIAHVGLLVTPEMMPSFRFVAFYSIPWEGREEVVPDSIWVDVTDSCAGGLTVGPVGEVRRDYMPGKSFSFQVRGDPGAKVSLVAVDNAVYLLSRERLTQSKIWNVVEHGDIGCTRGGGRDATAVFSGAGLLYASNAGFKTQTRQALQCPDSARRRRSAELLQRKAQLESQYKEKLQRRCCNDGLRAIPMPYSCTRRSLYITEGWECMRAFRYCCSTYRNEMFDTEIPTTPPPMTTPPPTTTTQRPRPTFPQFGRAASKRLMIHSWRDIDVYAGRRTMESPVLRGLPGPPQPEVHMEYTRSFVHAAASEEHRPVIHLVEEETAGEVEEEEEEEWEYLDRSDVYLRSKFFESWLWQDINLPSQADRDGFASMNVNNALPDSITEWGLLAISASPHTGFCVAEPYNIRAWKRFFVDLKLPYSVARNEQIEIKAVVHNYGYEDLHVRVVLMKTKDICSIAFKDRHTQEVKLAAGSSVVVPYTIIPLVVGKLPLEVMVVGRDMMGGDRIQKFLRVVMDGVQKTEVWTTVLNPAAEGGTQTVRMGKIELNSVVPNSQPETFINIRGQSLTWCECGVTLSGNVLADSIDNSISEDSLASLIRMPGGCVEQNLATITLPLIATLYLERTGNWEGVGVERKAEALRYIKRGYENQLAYRKSDGSYPPYRSEGASTWITAYVVKVFSMAHSITGINKQQVCDPLLYLVKNKHRSYGVFVEDNPVYSTTMTGGLRGDDPMITLTAFVLIALTEAKQAGIRCNDPSANIESVTHNTAEYLKRALMKLGRRPYTVAIVSYALALQEKGRYNPTDSLLRAAARGGGHWPDSKNTLFTLEATGYALLALVKMGRMEEAAVPFKWLNSQRRRGGGFGSTQSTMVVLHALSEYLINKPPPDDLSLDVDVRIAGRKEIPYNFNPKTAYAARSTRLPANLDLEVQARGNGQGILEVVTYYNQLPEVDEKMPCKDFELNVTIEESSEKPPADVEKSYQITIKVRALGRHDVRMVVLDISLPTGFTPENSDLEMLSNSVDRYINNFKIVDNLSDRGSLIIHLFKVSHKEPEILIFRLQQNFKVGLLQPSSVTVYEYYNPDHRCSRAYTPSEDKEQLSQVCRDNVCRCTQVFQVKVLSVSQGYYDKYEMEITRVIKLGVEAGVEFGQKRIFLSHGGCRDGLNLKQGSQYLIIGPKEDQWNTDSENGFIYMLGKNTWVERWPSSAECSSDPSLQAKCKSLDDTAHELSVNACRL